jgi:hypothetical protein
MLGNIESPVWLLADALLLQFLTNRQDAIKLYIEFVNNSVNNIIWDE